MSNKKLSYIDSGVDIKKGEKLIENIKPFVKKTMRKEVLSELGGFGALFEISKNYNNPVLVSGTDGVGTKLKLACKWDMHDDIGIDLVAMCVNDILTHGAEPLFFLDYFSCGNLNLIQATKIIKSISKACEVSGCSLIGGETAEMPGMYNLDEYDLAGFSVGIVEKDSIITGKDIKENDIIIAIASSGAHSNGYSLIRKIIDNTNINLDNHFDDGKTLKQIIMSPTKIYVKSILNLIKYFKINGIIHITGGGLLENIPRVLPNFLVANLDSKLWEFPKLFKWIQQEGNIDIKEMYKTFNCGIGLILIVDSAYSEDIIKYLNSNGEVAFKIGNMIKRINNEHQVQIK